MPRKWRVRGSGDADPQLEAGGAKARAGSTEGAHVGNSSRWAGLRGLPDCSVCCGGPGQARRGLQSLRSPPGLSARETENNY